MSRCAALGYSSGDVGAETEPQLSTTPAAWPGAGAGAGLGHAYPTRGLHLSQSPLLQGWHGRAGMKEYTSLLLQGYTGGEMTHGSVIVGLQR